MAYNDKWAYRPACTVVQGLYCYTKELEAIDKIIAKNGSCVVNPNEAFIECVSANGNIPESHELKAELLELMKRHRERVQKGYDELKSKL